LELEESGQSSLHGQRRHPHLGRRRKGERSFGLPRGKTEKRDDTNEAEGKPPRGRAGEATEVEKKNVFLEKRRYRKHPQGRKRLVSKRRDFADWKEGQRRERREPPLMAGML